MNMGKLVRQLEAKYWTYLDLAVAWNPKGDQEREYPGWILLESRVQAMIYADLAWRVSRLAVAIQRDVAEWHLEHQDQQHKG